MSLLQLRSYPDLLHHYMDTFCGVVRAGLLLEDVPRRAAAQVGWRRWLCLLKVLMVQGQCREPPSDDRPAALSDADTLRCPADGAAGVRARSPRGQGCCGVAGGGCGRPAVRRALAGCAPAGAVPALHAAHRTGGRRLRAVEDRQMGVGNTTS